MSNPIQAQNNNRLLSLMEPDDFARLAPNLDWLVMPRAFVLAEADKPIEYVYFMDSGVASMVAISPEGLEAEAGLVGREGVAPTAPILGANVTPNHVNVQIEGAGWRIQRELFSAALADSASLRDLMHRFLQTMIVQTSYTALSNAVHTLDERLARWLLMCDDRMDAGELTLTHDFMSIMLAVRRPSVTTSMHILEGNGFIRAQRGSIFIRDRAGMEKFASDAYGRPEAAYRSLIGDMRPPLMSCRSVRQR